MEDNDDDNTNDDNLHETDEAYYVGNNDNQLENSDEGVQTI